MEYFRNQKSVCPSVCTSCNKNSECILRTIRKLNWNYIWGFLLCHRFSLRTYSKFEVMGSQLSFFIFVHSKSQRTRKPKFNVLSNTTIVHIGQLLNQYRESEVYRSVMPSWQKGNKAILGSQKFRCYALRYQKLRF